MPSGLSFVLKQVSEKGQRETQNSTVPLPFGEKDIRGKGQHVNPVINYARPREDE